MPALYLPPAARNSRPSVGSRINRSHPLAKGLIGYWPMLEGAGDTVHDYSGYGNHGTLTNMAPATDWVSERYGPAIELDGVDDHIALPYSSVFDIGTDDFTVLAQVKMASGTDFSSFLRVIDRTNVVDTNIEWQPLYFRNTGELRTGLDGAYLSPGGSTSIDNGQWRQIGVSVVRSGNAVFFLDGQQDGTPQDISAKSTINILGNDPVFFGRRNDSSTSYFVGTMGAILFYRRALSQAEIHEFYRDPWCLFRRPLIWDSGAVGAAYTLEANTIAYSYTGLPADLPKDSKLAAATESYSVTGTAVPLKSDKKTVASSGAYSYVGSTVALTQARTIDIEAGSYSKTGTAASLFYGVRLSAEAGSYAVTGSSVVLVYPKTLDIGAGSYAITGSSVSLAYNRKITASAGSYAYAGTAVTLSSQKVLLASAGAYSYSGKNVSLSHSGVEEEGAAMVHVPAGMRMSVPQGDL